MEIMMYDIEVTEEDLKKINKLRNDHPNKQIRKRLSILFYKARRLQHQEIKVVVECSSKLVTATLKSYLQGGLKTILKINRYKRVSELETYRDRILEEFKKSPPATAEQASTMMYQLTGIRRGITQTKKFLHKLGLQPRMTAGIPAKANPERQEEFKKKSWNLT
jgi:transposase